MGGSNDARPPPTAIRLSGYPPIRPGPPPTRLRHAQTRRPRRAFRHRPTRDPGAAARRVRDPAARPRHLPIARAAPQDETAGDPRRGPARRGGAPDLRHGDVLRPAPPGALQPGGRERDEPRAAVPPGRDRSEEHTSELQSRLHLVCRLLLEKKKKKTVRSG